MYKLLSFISLVFFLSCEQNMGITDQNEEIVEYIDQSDNVTRGLKLLEEKSDLELGVVNIYGLEGLNSFNISLHKTFFDIKVRDLISNEGRYITDWGDFGQLFFSNNLMEKNYTDHQFYYDSRFVSQIDLDNYDEDTKMSFEIKNSNRYEDKRHEMSQTFNELQASRILLIPTSDSYNFTSDYEIELSEKLIYQKSYIRIGFNFELQDEYTFFGHTGKDFSDNAILLPTENLDKYLINPELMKDLVHRAVTRFEKRVYRITGALYDFEKVHVTEMRLHVTKYDKDYDEISVKWKNSSIEYDLNITLNETDDIDVPVPRVLVDL